jgi:hypothetical protein
VNPNAPTIDELRRINLGPEIESLFGELRSMREKRNAIRAKLCDKEAELDRVAAECKHAKETEASLRQRLQLAEQNVVLLNSELMDLKEKASELKTSKANAAKLQQTVQLLQASDPRPLLKKIEGLEAQLSNKDEQLRSAARKVDRLRRRDPLLQFSRQVEVLNRSSAESVATVGAGVADGGGGGSSAASGGGATSNSSNSVASSSAFDSTSSALVDSFAGLQEDFGAEVNSAWAAVAARNGNAARHIVLACKEFYRKHLAHAALDAMVVISGNPQAATDFFIGAGFSVADQGGGRMLVSTAENSEAPAGMCGPFACAMAASILAASSAAASAAVVGLAPNSSAPSLLLDFSIISVHPVVSQALASNPKRTRLEFDTSRSSKPGGQAANVSETQITVRLFIDNCFAFSSEAQDTRSAVNNKSLAVERLTSERLAQYNSELAASGIARKFSDESAQAALMPVLDGDESYSSTSSSSSSPLQSMQALGRYVDEAAGTHAISRADAVFVQSLTAVAARSSSSKN